LVVGVGTVTGDVSEAVVGMVVCTAKAMLQGKRNGVWGMLVKNVQDRAFTRTMTMFDAQIALALFAAFLLGVVAGSGMEIIVRGGRH